jgi:hypothetical protein
VPGPIRILIAAAFTLAASWRLGRVVMDRVHAPFSRMERELLSGVCGASLLSLLVLICCVLNIARPGVLLGLGAMAIALPIFAPGTTVVKPIYPALSRALKLVFGIPYAVYLALYLANSLAPEMSPDGAAYHLGLVYRYFRQGGFHRFTTNIYEYLSKGIEMLYLFAFSFGGRSAAATVHCAYLLALPLLILSYARRRGRPWAGACAAMLVYLSPLVGIDGVSAYTDVALAATAFSVFYLLEIWRENSDAKYDAALLIAVGFTAGYCFAIKFTGVVAVFYAMAVVLINRRPRALVPVLAAAAVVMFPWPLKNWLWTGNPGAPFLNRLFPNPYVHVSFETSYTRFFATYNLPEYHSLPWKLAVGGDLGGQIGPLFLLAPLALLSLRSADGRRCLAAALFFLLPYPANLGPRFLIPALPFLAAGIAFALDFRGWSRYLFAALIAAAAILGWPRIIRHYRSPAGTWQITTMPWKAALGLIRPEDYLEQRFVEYRIARMVDAHAAQGERVWSTMQVAESYEKPDILVSYQSAEGELLDDILASAIQTDRQPLWNLRFTFTPRSMQAITFEQRNRTESDTWSIGEVKFFRGDSEVKPVIRKATATPFAWDAWLAVDGNPLTRWKSWEWIRPGMRWSATFAAPVIIDRVELRCAHDQWAIDVHMDGVQAKLEKLDAAPYGDLRGLATSTVKARGVGYLLTSANSPLHAEFRRDPSAWRITPVAQGDGASLWRIN